MHELSHFLAAVVLRVPVASFSIMPKVTPTGILFGRVSIQKVDPFRSAIIAIAPLLTGAISLFLVLNWLKTNAKLDAVTLIACYSTLCLINMMIPSKQDVKVALPGLVIITAIAVGIYVLFFLTRTSLY